MLAATSSSSTEPLRLTEVRPPPLRPNQVRVKTRAIGVNPVDWKMREGGPLRIAYAFLGPSGPFVCGIDFAGEVVEVGAAIGETKVGDRVFGGIDFSRKQLGSYAEEVRVEESQCAPIPEGVSFDQAACLPVPGATAWQSLVDFARIDRKKDTRVLVLGAAGGVGLASLQIARELGAKAVGVCSSRNVALVERMGATAIDYGTGDALAQAKEHGPFDAIVNAVGTDPYALGASRALMKKDGALSLVVVRPADSLAIGFCGNVRAALGRPRREVLAKLAAMVAGGRFECVIEDRIPLKDAEEAQRRSRAGKVVGKLLLIP